MGKSCELTSPRFLSPGIEPSCVLASAGHMHSLSHYKAGEAQEAEKIIQGHHGLQYRLLSHRVISLMTTAAPSSVSVLRIRLEKPGTNDLDGLERQRGNRKVLSCILLLLVSERFHCHICSHNGPLKSRRKSYKRVGYFIREAQDLLRIHHLAMIIA